MWEGNIRAQTITILLRKSNRISSFASEQLCILLFLLRRKLRPLGRGGSAEEDLLKHQTFKPILYIHKGAEISLSGEAMVEFLRAVLAKGAALRFRAKGFSMSPFIRDGDVLTVFPLSCASAGLGDIVAFAHPKTAKLVVHRLIDRKDGFFLLRGDNAFEKSGERIPEENILGQVKRAERGKRKIFVGFGPERFLIAWLSRRGILSLLLSIRSITPPCIKKLIR